MLVFERILLQHYVFGTYLPPATISSASSSSSPSSSSPWSVECLRESMIEILNDQSWWKHDFYHRWWISNLVACFSFKWGSTRRQRPGDSSGWKRKTELNGDCVQHNLVGGLDHELYFFRWECHHPNWLSHIFQRGRSTTNQGNSSTGTTGSPYELTPMGPQWLDPIRPEKKHTVYT